LFFVSWESFLWARSIVCLVIYWVSLSVGLAYRKRQGKIYIGYGRGRCKCFEVIFFLVSFLLSFILSFNIVNFSFFFHPIKPFFFSLRFTVLPIQIAYPIISIITTRSDKCYTKFPTKFLKYRVLKVFENKPTISFSNKRGLTCAADSRHL
jgi:hypothetical protein